VVCEWIKKFTTHVASVEASLAPDLGIIVSGYSPKPVIISNNNASQTFGRAVALLLHRHDDIFEDTDAYDVADNAQVIIASPLSVVKFVHLNRLCLY
jgi:hypothetical protein